MEGRRARFTTKRARLHELQVMGIGAPCSPESFIASRPNKSATECC